MNRYTHVVQTLQLCSITTGHASVSALHRAVFFNLFAAAEPYTSIKDTHGTPCESSDVGEVKATGCLQTHFPGRAKPPWGWQSKQRGPITIWNLTALVGSSKLSYLTKQERRGGCRLPRPVSESERDFSHEQATIHASELKRAKFKMAHDFSRATVCNASRILAVVEASVLLCVSVALLSVHRTLRLYQNGAS